MREARGTVDRPRQKSGGIYSREKRQSQIRALVQAKANEQATARARTRQWWKMGFSLLENHLWSYRPPPCMDSSQAPETKKPYSPGGVCGPKSLHRPVSQACLSHPQSLPGQHQKLVMRALSGSGPGVLRSCGERTVDDSERKAWGRLPASLA
jgi:hypothetical protein